MKLELRHITPYLPYDLKVWYNETLLTLCSVEKNVGVHLTNGDANVCESFSLDEVKPALRYLSSMTKEEASDLLSIAVFGHKTNYDDIDYITLEVENDYYIVISGIFKSSFYDSSIYTLYIMYDEISYTVTDDEEETSLIVNLPMYEYLFEKHFDIFGLIDNVLAIDKTKLQ